MHVKDYIPEEQVLAVRDIQVATVLLYRRVTELGLRKAKLVIRESWLLDKLV
jgi:hypothetical protein